MKPTEKIRWGIIVVAAFVIEAALFAILIPVQILFGMQVFQVAVPVAVVVITFVLTMLFGRRIHAQFLIHGLLIGLIATLIYLGLLVSLRAVPTALATYGLFMFVVINVSRIVAAMMGTVVEERRQLARNIGSV